MAQANTCGNCLHFRNDADHLEQSFPGLTAMSSGRGAVRAADGLCSRHGLYLASFAHCDDLEPKALPAIPPMPARGRYSILSIRNRLASGGPR
jgi:hypothetical protein